MYSRIIPKLAIGLSISMLSACSIAKNYTEAEKDTIANLTPSKYQPATRELRSSIETQDLLAQAAFWSREHQLNPADLEATVKLASAVRKMGNPGKAVEITQTARAMYPMDPYLIAEYAAALIAVDRGSDAIKPIGQALRGAPGYARLWSLKGAALDQVGNYDQARQHYGRALQITPNDPNIMANMGLSFALAGDPNTAERWLRQASSHPEASDSIRQNLDLILQLQGKPNQLASNSAPRSPATQQQYGGPRQLYAAPRPTMPLSQQRLQHPTKQAYAQPQRPQVPGDFGHRSSRTVIGNQAGAPRNAAEMARAVASQSNDKRVVVPHQAPIAPRSGNILDQIGRSVQQKRAGGAPAYPQAQGQARSYAPMPQSQQRSMQRPMQNGTAYPQPAQPQSATPSRRGAARRR